MTTPAPIPYSIEIHRSANGEKTSGAPGHNRIHYLASIDRTYLKILLVHFIESNIYHRLHNGRNYICLLNSDYIPIKQTALLFGPCYFNEAPHLLLIEVWACIHISYTHIVYTYRYVKYQVVTYVEGSKFALRSS